MCRGGGVGGASQGGSGGARGGGGGRNKHALVFVMARTKGRNPLEMNQACKLFCLIPIVSIIM